MNHPKNEHQRANTDLQATVMLCHQLNSPAARTGIQDGPEPLHTEDFHRLASALHQQGLSVGDLIDPERSTDASEALEQQGYEEGEIAHLRDLLSRGFALALRHVDWKSMNCRPVCITEPDYPVALTRLRELSPPAIWISGDSVPSEWADPAAQVAILTPQNCGPRTNPLLETVAQKFADSGRTAALSLQTNTGQSLLLRILQNGGSAIAITGAQNFKDTTLTPVCRDAIREGRLTVMSLREPEHADQQNSQHDAVLRALAGQAVRVHQNGVESC